MAIKNVEVKGLLHAVDFVCAGEVFQKQASDFLSEKGKSYKVQGFRPGKVPQALVVQRFGAEAREHAINVVVRQETDAFFAEKKKHPLLKPSYRITEVPDLGKEGDFLFSMTFESEPEVPEVLLDQIKIVDAKVALEDSDIEALLAEWVAEETKTVSIKEERPAHKGDILVVDVKMMPKGSEPHEMKDVSLVLDPKVLGEELYEDLNGVSRGEEVTRKTRIPKNVKDAKVAGKKVPTTYAVRDIKVRVPLEGVADLPQVVGVDDDRAVREKAKEILEARAKDWCFLWKKRQILDYLSEKSHFDLPDAILEEEYKKLWGEALKEVGLAPKALKASKNMSSQENEAINANEKKRDLEKGEKKALEGDAEAVSSDKDEKGGAAPGLADEVATQKARDDVFQKAFHRSEHETQLFLREVAKRRVLLGFVVSKLGQELQVSLSDDEVKDLVIQEMHRFPGQEKEVAAFYQKSPQALAMLKAPLFEKKVIDVVLEKYPPQETKEMTLTQIEAELEKEDFVLSPSKGA